MCEHLTITGGYCRRPHWNNGSRHGSPFRTIREWVGEVFARSGPQFMHVMHAVCQTGRSSIPSEPLRSARWLHVFYGVWREWQLMAPLDPNLLSVG